MRWRAGAPRQRADQEREAGRQDHDDLRRAARASAWCWISEAGTIFRPGPNPAARYTRSDS
jgi:hypothetical protein